MPPQPEPAHPQYFCRNNDEKTKILKAIPAAEGRYNLIAAEDQYEDESRTPEVTIARRLGLSHAEVTHEGETLERLQANGVLMWLYPNRSSVLDPVYLDGDISAVFHASFQVGLRRSHHGEYTCVKDGYLALTINGNVPGDFPDFIAANDGFVFHLLKEEEPGTEPVFACIIKQDTPYVATYIQKGECLTSRDQSRLLGYAYTEKRPNTEQTYTCTKGFPGGFSFITTTKEDPECPEGTELGARVGFQGRGSSPIGWVPVAQYLPPKPQTRSIYAADSELGFEHRTVNNGDRVARLIDQPIPGTIKLTQCVYSQKFGMGNNRTATYNTVDVGVGCAAQSTTRVLGYAYMEEQPNTEPVYRCFDRKLGNRFDAWKIGTPSLNPGCNGVVVGYVPKP